jgi:hypothetical protein
MEEEMCLVFAVENLAPAGTVYSPIKHCVAQLQND